MPRVLHHTISRLPDTPVSAFCKVVVKAVWPRPWQSVVIDPSEIVSRLLIGRWLPFLACDWLRVRNRESRTLSACPGQLFAGAWLTTLVRNILHRKNFWRTKISFFTHQEKRKTKQKYHSAILACDFATDKYKIQISALCHVIESHMMYKNILGIQWV